MKNKKAGMFLYTVLFVIVIGAGLYFLISYLGFPNQQTRTSRCVFPPGISCVDHPIASGGTLTLGLKNNIGAPIIVKNVQITPIVCTGTKEMNNGSGYMPMGQEINNDRIFWVRLTSCNVSGYFESKVTVNYYNLASGLDNAVQGDIRGSVE
jgi:hypothetical protein